ncbi:bifunctional precorrin-2 dehydrogenase/sirohydrochlorin ferrochelatase [Litoribacter ruber]|uniref:precorrin-2 dehydrogenase/sirohydrochlorin ferrochelatase family protein n=1 Tax=Litoribacter ruber TaxID=702568 RepID=UPI001BDA50D1|nr:bifunctional precorrin-2 dehydrogenase/sirohydrochlorin ferrochelatase [Litoribacter ruber]MBT0812209.1 bifunctional precorrin-2 dehydrogenase/sirohydrochlorin ferrochelatase [Litoribacter ruber]
MNELYPIFLKVNQLNVLLVGAGKVGLEKLTFLLKSSPNAHVTVVAKEISEEVRQLAKGKSHVTLIVDAYQTKYLGGKHIVIAATDVTETNHEIYHDAKERYLLVNVADTPAYCDFYLGGIVTKGNVKIAISTNGKSPTTAKRLRQLLEEVIPEDIDDLVNNLNEYRKTLKGDFEEKVELMNKITETLVRSKN